MKKHLQDKRSNRFYNEFEDDDKKSIESGSDYSASDVINIEEKELTHKTYVWSERDAYRSYRRGNIKNLKRKED